MNPLEPVIPDFTSRIKSPLYSEIMSSPTKASPLALSGSVTPANIGRRRGYTASLLSSPPRQSHSIQMASIFQTASASLRVAAPFYSTSFNGTPARGTSETGTVPKNSPNVTSSVDHLITFHYPTLPKISHEPFLLPARTNSQTSAPRSAEKARPEPTTPRRKNHHTLSPQHSKPQAPNTAHRTPIDHRKTAYHNLGRPGVPKRTPRTNTPASPSSSSSLSTGSWTGDSHFFHPAPPPHAVQRTSSVTKWLDKLPPTTAGEVSEAEAEAEDELLEPLSPRVEVERGSMRRRVRAWEREDVGRRVSVDDYDILVS